ncbi:PhlD [Streptomyces sp. NPDC053048]|uniref:PhlD n=1 Tax=Streptomyces sp. NPDC053048 TaxID=3365694 RepID=UPI0037D3E967
MTTDEICADIEAHHSTHPKLKALIRSIRASTVKKRYFSRPLDSAYVSGSAPLSERNPAAFSDAFEMAKKAVERTLKANSLTPADIDAIVTSHSTSWTVPSLDVRLAQELGFPPEISRIPMTSLACAGGAQALIRARDFVTAHPGKRVLIVVSETLSTTYNHEETTTPSMIFKGLFGDSAGACIVTDTPLGSGIQIDDTWEYVVSESHDWYRSRVETSGVHFPSTREALNSIRAVKGPLLDWLGDWRPDVPVIHTGGPRIISDLVEALGLEEKAARHSCSSLEENGNLGGVAVLDVLSRTYEEPPDHGEGVLMVGFGPGFVISSCKGSWYHSS